jgi:hypothetical protein
MAEVPLNDDHVERLKRPIGTIILYWGLLDVMITEIAIRTFIVLKTPEVAHTIPMPFSGRLGVIKRNLRHIELEEEPTLQAFTVIEELKEIREVLVHGVAVAYDTDRDAILFSKIERLAKEQKLQANSSSASHQFQRISIPFVAPDRTAERFLEMHRFLASLLARLEAAAPPTTSCG